MTTSSGWASGLRVFSGTPSDVIQAALHRFIPDASPEQQAAWKNSIKPLQREVGGHLAMDPGAEVCSAVLEYEIPNESRRADVVFLISGAVLVLELKGRQHPTQADLDQVAGYVRDLRCYHRDCEHVAVQAVVVPMGAGGYRGMVGGVHICGPETLSSLLRELDRPRSTDPITPGRFLDPAAYRPLPSLIAAARALFQNGELPSIRRARAFTDPTVERIVRICHEAARTKTFRLVLVSGVPGAGKTLVGLQVAHAHVLDQLAVARSDGTKPSPAVYLSGNAPLVQVLQYQLKSAGGGGQAFVRGVKDYVKHHSRPGRVPNEHVLVFDEAQRAWDGDHVRAKHEDKTLRSEPEEFVSFAERIPEWCVIVGLIGDGQEIHTGEEGGIGQWSKAVATAKQSDRWTVHAPPALARKLTGPRLEAHPDLSLDTSLRQHGATCLARWVQGLLGGLSSENLRVLAEEVEREGFHLRLTRSVDTARLYLWDRYKDQPQARFGALGSSRDKHFPNLAIEMAGRFFSRGPWFGDPEVSPNSCRRLTVALSEFDCQGLELDATLLAWGTDLIWSTQGWDNQYAKKYRPKKGVSVKDPLQLRTNAYRVLMTRGRDAAVILVPEQAELDQTWERLIACSSPQALLKAMGASWK